MAHCRQTASSDWNVSNGLSRSGSTITLGPVGIVAQPPNTATARHNIRHRLNSMLQLPPLWIGRGRIRYDLHPAARAISDVRIVTSRIRTVVPVIFFRLLRLDIHRGLLLDDYRWGRIVAVRVPWDHKRASPVVPRPVVAMPSVVMWRPSVMSPTVPISCLIVSADKGPCFTCISVKGAGKKHCNYAKNSQEKFIHFHLLFRNGSRIHIGF